MSTQPSRSLPRGVCPEQEVLVSRGLQPMDYRDVDRLRVLLWEHFPDERFTVIARGESLTIASGTKPNLRKHARLTRQGEDRWSLEPPGPRGCWNKSLRTGRMVDLVDEFTALLAFPALAPVDGGGRAR